MLPRTGVLLAGSLPPPPSPPSSLSSLLSLCSSVDAPTRYSLRFSSSVRPRSSACSSGFSSSPRAGSFASSAACFSSSRAASFSSSSPACWLETASSRTSPDITAASVCFPAGSSSIMPKARITTLSNSDSPSCSTSTTGSAAGTAAGSGAASATTWTIAGSASLSVTGSASGPDSAWEEAAVEVAVSASPSSGASSDAGSSSEGGAACDVCDRMVTASITVSIWSGSTRPGDDNCPPAATCTPKPLRTSDLLQKAGGDATTSALNSRAPSGLILNMSPPSLEPPDTHSPAIEVRSTCPEIRITESPPPPPTVPITSVPRTAIDVLPASTRMFCGVFLAIFPETKRKAPFVITTPMPPLPLAGS